jgi:hypothetical protein
MPQLSSAPTEKSALPHPYGRPWGTSERDTESEPCSTVEVPSIRIQHPTNSSRGDTWMRPPSCTTCGADPYEANYLYTEDNPQVFARPTDDPRGPFSVLTGRL